MTYSPDTEDGEDSMRPLRKSAQRAINQSRQARLQWGAARCWALGSPNDSVFTVSPNLTITVAQGMLGAAWILPWGFQCLAATLCGWRGEA